MSDYHRSLQPQEGRIIDLVEKRNNKVFELLKELQLELLVLTDGIKEEFNEIKLMADLPFLEDPHINEKVTDLSIVRKNKTIKKESDGYVTSGQEITQKIYKLVLKIRDAMDFLYNTKFKNIMKASHVMSEADIQVGIDFINSDVMVLDELSFANTPVLVSLKTFIPEYSKYLIGIDIEVKKFIQLLGASNPNSEELKSELYKMQNQIQDGFEFVQYYSDLFEKYNFAK